jgi:hypothetical protein
MTDSKPKPPKGLQTRGRAFWRALTGEFELSPSEIELLREACRALDLVEELQARVAVEGADPAFLRELRAQRDSLSRMLTALHVPSDADESAPQSPTSARARRAANARWENVRRVHGTVR